MTAQERRAVHTFLDVGRFDRLEDFVDEHGVSKSAVVATMIDHLSELEGADAFVASCRSYDRERRRRGGRKPKPKPERGLSRR